MGDPFSGGGGMGGMFGMGGGGDDEKVASPKLTAQLQARRDAKAEDAFVNNFIKMFQNPATNNTFKSSLSGYYNGAPIDQIAKKMAFTNAYKPKVQTQYQEPEKGIFDMFGGGGGGMPGMGGGGMFGGGSMNLF